MQRLLPLILCLFSLPAPLLAVSAHAVDIDSQATTVNSACMPYTGEHLSFDVGWEFINAGTATMDISATDSGYQTRTFARTNEMLDIFKKVRDYITADGICVNGHMQSTLFDANLHERKYKAQKRTEFLWQENKVVHIQHNNKEYFDVPAGHLSVIDAFLAVRQLDLKAGETYKVPVFDSRERYEIIVNIKEKRKLLTTPWGEKVQCLEVTPKLKTAGLFTNRGEMTLWMTDDARHIPIKMMVKIRFGRIYVRLNAYSNHTLAEAKQAFSDGSMHREVR